MILLKLLLFLSRILRYIKWWFRLIKKGNLKTDKLQVESDDEREARLDAILSHTCGNLNENMQDVENDLIIDFSPVDRKKKTSTAKNLKHGRLPQKAKNPFENCSQMKGYSGIAEVLQTLLNTDFWLI